MLFSNVACEKRMIKVRMEKGSAAWPNSEETAVKTNRYK
jgi:hypothetical protein